MGRLISLLVIILFSLSCVPRVLITEHPKLVSYYFTKKIESLEKKKDLTFDQQRALLKTKVEYGFGILMEESDRVIDDNYNLGVQISRNAYIEFNEANIVKAQRAVMTINEGLWMGHYDIPADTMTPTFRYTCLLRGSEKASLTETIEDIVDIALIQCERHYPSLELISTVDSTVMNDNNFSLALMETVGES